MPGRYDRSQVPAVTPKESSDDYVVLGLATLEVGQRELGIAYLKNARRLADRQEYWLRMREAEEELYRLGALTSMTRI